MSAIIAVWLGVTSGWQLGLIKIVVIVELLDEFPTTVDRGEVWNISLLDVRIQNFRAVVSMQVT